MALEVVNDSRSEHYRNWVSSTVVQALGVHIDNGLWVLHLHALKACAQRIPLTAASRWTRTDDAAAGGAGPKCRRTIPPAFGRAPVSRCCAFRARTSKEMASTAQPPHVSAATHTMRPGSVCHEWTHRMELATAERRTYAAA